MPAWVQDIEEAGAVALYIDNSGLCLGHKEGVLEGRLHLHPVEVLQDRCTGLGVVMKVFHTGRKSSGLTGT